jgi:hypothetical protein
MGEAESLWCVAVGLYLVECFWRIPEGAAIFQARFFRRWSRVPLWRPRGPRGSAYALGFPLAPLGHTWVAAGTCRDREEAHARLAAWRSASRALVGAQSILWSIVFGVLPVAYYRPAWLSILGAAGSGLGIWILVIGLAVAGHRRLPPTVRPPLHELIAALASPLGAMRAHDVLARRLFLDLEPLVLAGLLLDPVAKARLGREVLVARAEDPAVAAMLAEMGLDPDRLLDPPEPDGPGSRAYCPVCLDQFVRVDVTCSVCGGVPVRAL